MAKTEHFNFAHFMKRRSLPLLLMFICNILIAFAQDVRLPHDSDKLVSRAQIFWTDIAKGQRSKALEFVLPARRDAFLASPPLPILGAHVVGIDVATDSMAATVRVEIESTDPDLTSRHSSWVITDRWAWNGGKWYADIGDPRDILALRNSVSGVDVEQTRKDLDRDIRLLKTTVDIGTVIGGDPVSVALPIVYDGKLQLNVEMAVPLPSLSVLAERGRNGNPGRFMLSFDSSNWDGPVSVPLTLRFRYFGATVDRSVTVLGSVFSPITFRQVPSDGPASPRDDISVFIKNNTGTAIPLQLLSTDNKADLVKSVSVLEANQETEVILRLKPDENSPILTLFPKEPVSGHGQFSYRLRIGH